MARLRWSPEAVADLESICAYIAADSEQYARIFARDVAVLIEELADHPRIGRIVPEYGEENLRERIYQNYRVVYELTGKFVEIVAIAHGARDFKNVPLR
ncbi:MAG TPA: type II toxin-antitoxin system RelE/ParE family toxin [Elusimicrobiota bacterium]|jgi:plasmid stabilization system protein ParE|nr:type II toxin-antitoxin system RelE/ParE family toxin [Elusimicrobiota bacterium]